jgi:hypothetical protein
VFSTASSGAAASPVPQRLEFLMERLNIDQRFRTALRNL